jgi:hypothetical protein
VLIALVAVWHDSVAQVAALMLLVVACVTAIGVVRLVRERDVPAVVDASVGG